MSNKQTDTYLEHVAQKVEELATNLVDVLEMLKKEGYEEEAEQLRKRAREIIRG